MSTRRTLAALLAVAVLTATLSVSVNLAAQQLGTLAGSATDEAREPYSNYEVRGRHVVTGEAVTVPLAADGTFAITGLLLPSEHLIELYDLGRDRVVCTEGPFPLTDQSPERLDINIRCGRNPIAWWLLGAGAAAATIGFAVASASQ